MSFEHHCNSYASSGSFLFLFQANHLRKHSVSVITKVSARQVLDAQGVPTIEAEVHTNRGVFSAISPTGHSSSMYACASSGDPEVCCMQNLLILCPQHVGNSAYFCYVFSWIQHNKSTDQDNRFLWESYDP